MLTRLYRGLLFLYPAEFRDEYGRELSLVFADRSREERSRAGMLLVWMRAVIGILKEAPKEHYHIMIHDIRYALRLMRHDAAVTAATIAIIALAIGSSTLVFSVANGLLLRPFPYPAQDRLVAVHEYSPRDPHETNKISFPNYWDIRARTRLLQDISVYTDGDALLYKEGVAESVPVGQVSDGFFAVLGVTPILGRTFTSADDAAGSPGTVVLGEGFWQRHFGRDPRVLGQSVSTGNSQYRIVGVVTDNIVIPDRAEIWFPMRTDPKKAPRVDYFLSGIARLKPGVTAAQATAELSSLLEQIHRENPAANNHFGIRAVPLREALAGTYRQAVVMLLSAVGLLLLIACANVSNLLLVKASARLREMAVRTALGATRRRLIRQLMCESAIFGLTGGVAGVLLARAGIPALLALIPIDIPRWMDFAIDGRVLAFALALSLITTIGFGLAPAVASFHRDLANSVKQGGRSTSSGRRHKLLRNSLVVSEVALSVLLLAGAGLMTRSLLALKTQALGYEPQNVLKVDIDYSQKRYPDGAPSRALIQHLRQEISTVAGVLSVAFTTGAPLDNHWGRIYTIEGQPVPLQDMPSVNHVIVAPGYFQTLGIPLLRGRDFAESDFDAPHIVIVTQSFARQHWPDGGALGKRVRFGSPANNEPWHTIVGVVADNRHGELKGEDKPTVYLPYSKDFTPNAILIRGSGEPLRMADAVKARIAGIDKGIAVSGVLSLEQILERASWRDRFFTVLLGVFAGMALLLAVVGLYAVLSYTVNLHLHEIGIRMALGASAANVRSMVMRNGMTLTATGLGLGVAAGLLLTRLLKSQLYQVSPLDPAAYGVAIGVLATVALVAAWVPSVRATRIDPVIALRQE
ncbi:MAG TPA: ABC transporter permease [Bryobacteraceae bacterium]|nr:ABC transporter permease [Bryobacteraceae bacterium]